MATNVLLPQWGMNMEDGLLARCLVKKDDVRHAIVAQQQGSPRVAAQVVPRARQLAKEQGIDLAQVRGTGPNGRILVTDVEQAISRQGGEVAPLRGLRKTIADPMMQSVQSMAQVTLTTEADVTEIMRLREALVSEWPNTTSGR